MRYLTRSILKKSLAFTLVFGLLLSCEPPKQPIFRYLENIKFSEISPQNINIHGSAVFYNPNTFPLELVETDIQVALDDRWLGKVAVLENISIEASKKFSLPLALSLPTDKFFENVGDMFALLSRKTVNLRYRGFIRVKVRGITFRVPIEEQQQVQLRK